MARVNDNDRTYVAALLRNAAERIVRLSKRNGVFVQGACAAIDGARYANPSFKQWHKDAASGVLTSAYRFYFEDGRQIYESTNEWCRELFWLGPRGERRRRSTAILIAAEAVETGDFDDMIAKWKDWA
jgi:hypothetical protein